MAGTQATTVDGWAVHVTRTPTGEDDSELCPTLRIEITFDDEAQLQTWFNERFTVDLYQDGGFTGGPASVGASIGETSEGWI